MTPSRIILFACLSAFFIVAAASMSEAAYNETLGFTDREYTSQSLNRG